MGAMMLWPEVDVLRQGDKLVVHVDVPGLSQEDVKVEVKNGALCISGERRGERTRGTFYRSIPLPDGAHVDTASSTFAHGTLKIEIDIQAGH